MSIDCGSGDGCNQCNKPTSTTYKADPVWTCDGSLQLRHVDLAVGQNFTIVIDCNYNSRSTFDSAVGYGWAFAHDHRLFKYPDGSIVICTDCGHQRKFINAQKSSGISSMRYWSHAMNNNYPVNRKLQDSIDSIFEDPSVGLGFLGVGVDFLSNIDEGDSLVQRGDPIERICLLRDKLEDYISQMAFEILELGEEEAPRIRAETTATLIILREIKNYFPEAFVSLKP